MYFIGVLETVGGFFLIIPKFRPYASFTLAIVMIGALFTKVIFGIINGVDADGIYATIRSLDLFFFFSTISIFLFLMTYKKNRISTESV